MKRIYSVVELDHDLLHRAGGKAASIARLIESDIPVPHAFVVTSDACIEHLHESGVDKELAILLNEHIDHDECVLRCDALRTQLLDTPLRYDIREELEEKSKLLNEWVAVRSSAIAEDGEHASWAGHFQTFLNTPRTKVDEAIRRCWASIIFPHNIEYGHKQHIHSLEEYGMAVLIQDMVQSDVAGVAFSMHPITGNTKHVVIEAAYGLGEAVVGGHVVPDRYVFDKRSKELVDYRVASQDKVLQQSGKGTNTWSQVPEHFRSHQKLPMDHIEKLANVIVHIERVYEQPVDIEWAYADGSMQILQCRPITTL